ncbi:MAG: hypothetical protein ACRERV_14710, partial [Methylococcales bacterium]
PTTGAEFVSTLATLALATRPRAKNDSTSIPETPPTTIDAENVLEYAEERAAILEYDAGMPRKDAEQEAVRRAILKFSLNEHYGNPPTQGGGSLIGAFGDTIEDLKAELIERYGERLAWMDGSMTLQAGTLHHDGEPLDDPFDDQLHYCRECQNLTSKGLCLAGKQVANDWRYHPVDTIPRRCVGFIWR